MAIHAVVDKDFSIAKYVTLFQVLLPRAVKYHGDPCCGCPHLGAAVYSYLHLDHMESKEHSPKDQVKNLQINVISTLLYGSESWKVTKTISNKLDVFQNRCLRRILQICWPNTITNEELHRRAEIEPISTQVKRRRWRWIGHVLRQQTTALTRIALRWTPDGQRKRGRPKETWRRTVEREMKEKGWTWGRLERVSADRHRWWALVEALCAT